MDSYKSFDGKCWGCNSVVNANKLAAIFPHHVRIEETSLIHPTFQNDAAMYGSKVYNYSNNYSVHIYNQFQNHFIPQNEKELEGYNCTLGRIMRHVLYGNPELIDKIHVRNGFLKPGQGNDKKKRLVLQKKGIP